MTSPIVNIADVELHPRPAEFAATGDAAERFDPRIGQIGTLIGARRLGYNVTALAPGKRAFPFHNHRVNEEMFFVIAGRGEIRIGGSVYDVGDGDIIACPPGGAETAHQIVNTGDTELRFLAVSTMDQPEVAEYPDSGKFAVMARFAGEAGEEEKWFRYVGRESGSISYWDGE